MPHAAFICHEQAHILKATYLKTCLTFTLQDSYSILSGTSCLTLTLLASCCTRQLHTVTPSQDRMNVIAYIKLDPQASELLPSRFSWHSSDTQDYYAALP